MFWPHDNSDSWRLPFRSQSEQIPTAPKGGRTDACLLFALEAGRMCRRFDTADRLASQLKENKSAACRRKIERILELVKKDYEAGGYNSPTEAEREFRRLVTNEEICKQPQEFKLGPQSLLNRGFWVWLVSTPRHRIKSYSTMALSRGEYVVVSPR